MLSVAATYIFMVLVAIMILFQLALSAGAPWGSIAMGGKYPGTLPSRLRLSALVRAAILTLLGLVVLVRAKLILPEFYFIAEVGIWVVVVAFGLSLANNLTTPSMLERIIWAPIVAVVIACTLLIAIL